MMGVRSHTPPSKRRAAAYEFLIINRHLLPVHDVSIRAFRPLSWRCTHGSRFKLKLGTPVLLRLMATPLIAWLLRCILVQNRHILSFDAAVNASKRSPGKDIHDARRNRDINRGYYDCTGPDAVLK